MPSRAWWRQASRRRLSRCINPSHLPVAQDQKQQGECLQSEPEPEPEPQQLPLPQREGGHPQRELPHLHWCHYLLRYYWHDDSLPHRCGRANREPQPRLVELARHRTYFVSGLYAQLMPPAPPSRASPGLEAGAGAHVALSSFQLRRHPQLRQPEPDRRRCQSRSTPHFALHVPIFLAVVPQSSARARAQCPRRLRRRLHHRHHHRRRRRRRRRHSHSMRLEQHSQHQEQVLAHHFVAQA